MSKKVEQLRRKLQKALVLLQRPAMRLATEHDWDGLRRWSVLLLQKMSFLIQSAVREAWTLGIEDARRWIEQHRFQEVEIPRAWWDWYVQTLETSLTHYSERTQRRIAHAVWRASLEGWSSEDLTDEVQQIVRGLLTWQAERIARTEIMKLWNLGHVFELVHIEEVEGFEYSVVLDPRTSPICRPLAGVRVRKKDLRAVPPLHPNCRTILIPVFVTEEGEWSDPSVIQAAEGFETIPVALLQEVSKIV